METNKIEAVRAGNARATWHPHMEIFKLKHTPALNQSETLYGHELLMSFARWLGFVTQLRQRAFSRLHDKTWSTRKASRSTDMEETVYNNSPSNKLTRPNFHNRTYLDIFVDKLLVVRTRRSKVKKANLKRVGEKKRSVSWQMNQCVFHHFNSVTDVFKTILPQMEKLIKREGVSEPVFPLRFPFSTEDSATLSVNNEPQSARSMDFQLFCAISESVKLTILVAKMWQNWNPLVLCILILWTGKRPFSMLGTNIKSFHLHFIKRSRNGAVVRAIASGTNRLLS